MQMFCLIRILFISCSYIICRWIPEAGGTCTLPFGEEDSYISASIGKFNANSTHLINYPTTIPIPGLDAFNFECQEQQGDRYVLKAIEEPEIFSSKTKFWMCIELHKVDNVTFYYFLGTEYSAFAQDYLLGSSTLDATFEQACSTPYPYNQQTFVMLVQEDALSNGLLTTRCPDDLLAVFLRYNVSSATANTIGCAGSTLDVCTDRTMMSFTYNDTCSTPAKTTSTSGNYSCLYYTTVGDSSYLALWNHDTSVDGTNNYRYSCLAYRKDGDTVYATETPNFCTSTTTATIPETNGVTLVLWDIEITCLDPVPVVPTVLTVPVDITWLYYLIAGLAVLPLLIWFICFFSWCYRKYGCICKHIKCPKVKLPKRKLKNARLTPKPVSEPEIDVSKGETVERIRFTGPIRQAPNFNMSHLFRPKKPIDDFSMLSTIFLDQKPITLLEAPKVGPIYKDTLDDYMCGGIRRSYTQISIDSGIYEKKEDED